MLDSETTFFIAQVLTGCVFLGGLSRILLAHRFPIRKRIIQIKEDKK